MRKVVGLLNLLLLAYFPHFALPALGGGFGEDEMMNLYEYWWPGAFKSIQANICFWSTFYRPAGALYYVPLYHSFYSILCPIGSFRSAYLPPQSRSSFVWRACSLGRTRWRFWSRWRCAITGKWLIWCLAGLSSTM